MIEGRKKIQLGVKSVLGTEVNATTLWRGKADNADESEVHYPEEHVGFIGGVGRNYVSYQDGTIPVEEVECTFEQLPYLLNMGVEHDTPAQDGAGSGYVYAYDLPENAALTPDTYTVEIGDEQQAEIFTGVFAEEITISGASTEAWMMSATLRGQPRGVTTFTAGLSIPTVEEVLFGKSKLFIDAIGGSFGGTQITSSFLSFELTISNIYQAVATGEGANLFYTFLKMNSEPEITLNFTLEHDAQAVAQRVIRRAGTPQLFRVEGIGATLGTGATYTTKEVLLDLVGTYMEPGAYNSQDGNLTVDFVVKNHYNTTAATRGNFTVVNELTALP